MTDEAVARDLQKIRGDEQMRTKLLAVTGVGVALGYTTSALAAGGGHEMASTRDPVSQAIVAVILVCVFALLAADRVHRVLIPIAAVALIWLISYFTPFHLISFETAKDAVDLNVILLLASMMMLVGVLKTTNVFPWAVDRLLERSRGNPSLAATLIIWFTGVLSAFLDNVTTVIFTYPMASEMARRLRINGSAFFLPMVMAANIGGTATLIGDPPNVLIGADPRTGLSFMEFIYHLTVPCTAMMFVLVWYAKRYYPADIGSEVNRDHEEAARPTGAQLQNVRLLRWTCWLTALIFAGFMTHTLTGMQVAVPAVIGIAVVLLLQDYFYLQEHKPTHEERQHGVLAILEKEVEWPTLFFFLFLFVLVGAAVATGLIDSMAHGLAWIINGASGSFGLSKSATLLLAALLILWVSGFLSAVIDNIPYTAVTIPLVASLIKEMGAGPDGQVLWWALSLGACLGGNGTLIGASANVTVTGLAEKDGKRISFNEFTAFGARVTGITLLMASLYLTLWIYVGSTSINIAGAVVLAAIIVLSLLRARPPAMKPTT
jgi:Na+/H+ antiporter NhaD/arsenite permease-like protein